MLSRVLKVIAAGCFLLALFNVTTKFALVPLGLLFWVVADIV